MVNIIMEKSTFTGRDSSGKEHYRAVMLADTTDELPAREWNGIVLEQGSSITSIGEGAEYLMNSAGAWVRQGGGGGSSLPDVTADDNGNVLTVVDGEWDKAEPEAGLPAVTGDDDGDILCVTGGAWSKVTPTKDTVVIKCTNGKLPNDMKCSDVVAFINAGKEVVIYDSPQYYRVANEAVLGTTFIFIGLGYNVMQSSFFISYLSVTNNNSTSVIAGTTKFITTS